MATSQRSTSTTTATSLVFRTKNSTCHRHSSDSRGSSSIESAAFDIAARTCSASSRPGGVLWLASLQSKSMKVRSICSSLSIPSYVSDTWFTDNCTPRRRRAVDRRVPTPRLSRSTLKSAGAGAEEVSLGGLILPFHPVLASVPLQGVDELAYVAVTADALKPCAGLDHRRSHSTRDHLAPVPGTSFFPGYQDTIFSAPPGRTAFACS